METLTGRREKMLTTIREIARQYVAHGFSVLPILANGSKSPAIPSWKSLQSTPPTARDIEEWFGNGGHLGLGIIGGQVSHSLEILDFDDVSLYEKFLVAAEQAGLSPLLDRMRAGCEESTPRGIHLPYYCSEIAGNTKLAKRPATTEEATTGLREKALIETRGEGGYVIAAPSGGTVHESGKPYVILRGSWLTVATIAPEERADLWTLCRTFDRMPPRLPAPTERGNGRGNVGDRPGDLFANATSWQELLGASGWTWVYRHGDIDYWRRPGKNVGISASTNYAGSDLFYCFSSSTSFDTERGYGKFSAYATLEHGGDFHAASLALIAKGYGRAREEIPFPSDEDAPPSGNGKMASIAFSETDIGTGDIPESDFAESSFPLTEMGNAERFIAQHGTEVRYCNPWKKWLIWEGKRWLLDDQQLVKKHARNTIRAIYLEASLAKSAESRKKIAAHAMKSEAQAASNAMLGLAQMDCPIMPHELDADPWAFNVQNGTIDLTTGKLTPHAKSAFISKIASLYYDPTARAEIWEGFLDQTFEGNQELITWIQRAIGYSLTGDMREQSFFLCYGTGSNGKTTFLNTLQSLLGEYAEQTSFQTFLQTQNETVRNDLAKLQNCRFAAAIEADEGRRLAEGLIKQLTGQDAISTRFLYGEYFTFKPQFKIWLATNHKPDIRGTDHAIWRRVKLIPFLSTISEKNRDESLPDKLKAELSGILTWAIHGCLEWQKFRLTPAPEAVTFATNMYRKDQDTLGQFFEDCCVLTPAFTTPSADLYQAYKSWCEQNSEKPMSQKALGARLKERGLTNSKNTLTDRAQWQGVGLKYTENTVEQATR